MRPRVSPTGRARCPHRAAITGKRDCRRAGVGTVAIMALDEIRKPMDSLNFGQRSMTQSGSTTTAFINAVVGIKMGTAGITSPLRHLHRAGSYAGNDGLHSQTWKTCREAQPKRGCATKRSLKGRSPNPKRTSRANNHKNKPFAPSTVTVTDSPRQTETLPKYLPRVSLTKLVTFTPTSHNPSILINSKRHLQKRIPPDKIMHEKRIINIHQRHPYFLVSTSTSLDHNASFLVRVFSW